MKKDLKSSSQAQESTMESCENIDSPELQSSNFEDKDNAIKTNEVSPDENKTPFEESTNSINSKIDKELHNEILEKLDITQKKQPQDTQEKSVPQKPVAETNYLDRIKTKTQVEQAISQDFAKIQKLIKSGLIKSEQGQNLKKQVITKAFNMLVQTEKIKRGITVEPAQKQQAPDSIDKNKVFEEFGKSNPDFFTPDGRKEVLNYLKSNDVTFGTDELDKISEIIRTVEETAINRYLQNAAHEKTLRESNESAKQRLTANAQKSSLSGTLLKNFTREQIGKMSAAEFAKYEPQIMEQLKKGLIK